MRHNERLYYDIYALLIRIHATVDGTDTGFANKQIKLGEGMIMSGGYYIRLQAGEETIACEAGSRVIAHTYGMKYRVRGQKGPIESVTMVSYKVEQNMMRTLILV